MSDPDPPEVRPSAVAGRVRAPDDPEVRPPLIPPPDLAGPKIVLGIVWASITAAALLAGPVVLGIWLAIVAGLAGTQAARSWKRIPTRHPLPPASGGAAMVSVLGACFGPVGFAGAAAVALVGAAIWSTVVATQRSGANAPGGDVVLTVACAAVPALAAAGPVLLRGHGLVAALVLVIYALVHDASAFLIGAGARRPWEGPLAGVASIGSVTVAVAAIFPQFKGASPWELGILAALLTPLGPVVSGFVVGSHRARIPALRRLDSLVLLGPIWALAAAALVS
ncbi:MAG: hypothetical protein NVS1B12_09850 [Acidimicrobiales bacterium]